MTYFTLYIIIIPLLCYICYIYGKRKYLPFLLLVILSLIRYDTTSDYHNYVRIFFETFDGQISEKQKAEYGFVLLNKFFGFSKWGFIGVFAVVTLSIYYTFMYYFKKYDILCIGTFILLCMGCMTNYDNIVRQTMAIALFNTSILLFTKKKYIYAIIMVLVAPAFHTSAYVMLIFIPLSMFFRRIIVPKKIMYLTIVVLFLLYYSGAFDAVRDYIFSLSFVVNGLYGDYADVEFAKSYIGVAFIIKTLICMFTFSVIDKIEDKNIIMCINMTWLYIIIEIIFSGIPFFYRIGDYLSLFYVVSISYSIMFYINNSRKRISYMLIITLYLLLINHVVFYYGVNNMYNTIASDNCREHKFYIRQTFDEIQINGGNVDRNRYYILNNY